MDFIKKHFEKLILAIGLLVLIGCAAYLAYRVTMLSDEIQEAPQRSLRKPKATVTAISTTIYTNAITGLQVPTLWQTNAVDPFHTQLDWVRPVAAPITNVFSVALKKIIHQPFKLIFRSYTGKGDTFQVDSLTGNQSFIVNKIGGKIAHVSLNKVTDTGFVISKFEKKSVDVFNPSLGVTNTVDVSELTITKADGTRILLVLNRTAYDREPIAVVLCQSENEEHTVHKGDDFNCGERGYNVIDITSTQVIIEDTQSKEKHTIGLPDAKE